MKKNLTLVLLLILFAFTCQAQEIYSKENLQKTSLEDLNVYLEKAQKLKKAGSIVTIAGSATTVTGLVLIAMNSESTFYHGFFMSIAGPIITLVGLPILLTNSSRIKRINKIKDNLYGGVTIDLAPSGIYNCATQNYQPGITLRLRF